MQHFERAREAAVGWRRTGPRSSGVHALLCDLGHAYETAGQTEAAEATYVEAIERATRRGDAVGLAAALLGLMGGVDESVGFNLTGTETSLVDMLDDARRRLPADAAALRAMVTARVAGATYDGGDVEAAQRLSAEALDLARAFGRRARDRRRAQRAAHRAVVSRSTRRSPATRRRAARARPGVLGASGGVARRRPARVRTPGRSRRRHVRDRGRAVGTHPATRHVGTPRSTGRCARRSTVASTTRRGLRGSTGIGEQLGARTAGVCYAVQSLFVARERRELDGLAEVLDALAEEHPEQPGS